ncbi:hypothetical protein TSOC_005721 [Tetrabaena socialis]|uniref:Reverse transcriptase zinc-binding domain-containing protein n=1 Tax=Tetrabaena socialis TaxID=47790 RepID=A0A2J8A5I0_9CHLO|nr:hypothetical protein TSOC_005721 [Tetrabaena socialis]|eukprot:PNH07792.1 hypothetical protein TSOC_005721 [Tetrabaena socialis]
MRFRLGCWPLEANRPETSVAREHRVCTRCEQGVVEDEMHVLLECPEYEAARAALPCGPGSEMRSTMVDSDPRQLAEALGRIWERRFGEIP